MGPAAISFVKNIGMNEGSLGAWKTCGGSFTITHSTFEGRFSHGGAAEFQFPLK